MLRKKFIHWSLPCNSLAKRFRSRSTRVSLLKPPTSEMLDLGASYKAEVDELLEKGSSLKVCVELRLYSKLLESCDAFDSIETLRVIHKGMLEQSLLRAKAAVSLGSALSAFNLLEKHRNVTKWAVDTVMEVCLIAKQRQWRSFFEILFPPKRELALKKKGDVLGDLFSIEILCHHMCRRKMQSMLSSLPKPIDMLQFGSNRGIHRLTLISLYNIYTLIVLTKAYADLYLFAAYCKERSVYFESSELKLDKLRKRLPEKYLDVIKELQEILFEEEQDVSSEEKTFADLQTELLRKSRLR